MDTIKNIIIIIIIVLLINEIFFSKCNSKEKIRLIPHDFDPAKINPASL